MADSPFSNDQELRLAALDRAIHWLSLPPGGGPKVTEEKRATPAAILSLAGKFEAYLRG